VLPPLLVLRKAGLHLAVARALAVGGEQVTKQGNLISDCRRLQLLRKKIYRL